jgi:hypothetical protein
VDGVSNAVILRNSGQDINYRGSIPIPSLALQNPTLNSADIQVSTNRCVLAGGDTAGIFLNNFQGRVINLEIAQ